MASSEPNQPLAPDEDPAALWNGTAGHAWVESQTLLDRMFKPFEDQLVEAAAALRAGRVLDVGCGTGGTTLAIARRLGAGAACTGIDVSAPMIEAARARARYEDVSTRFILADAQRYDFEDDGFDAIVSRFGVMFFDDPVRAFANLRRAARSTGQLHFIVWRDPSDNPFMTTAERAAAPLVAALPSQRPDGPGQFALSDPARIRHQLSTGGWHRITVDPTDVTCRFPESGLVPYFTRMGPLGRVFGQCSGPERERIVAVVRNAFDPFVHGDEVRFDAACWTVRAHAAASSTTPG